MFQCFCPETQRNFSVRLTHFLDMFDHPYNAEEDLTFFQHAICLPSPQRPLNFFLWPKNSGVCPHPHQFPQISVYLSRRLFYLYIYIYIKHTSYILRCEIFVVWNIFVSRIFFGDSRISFKSPQLSEHRLRRIYLHSNTSIKYRRLTGVTS